MTVFHSVISLGAISALLISAGWVLQRERLSRSALFLSAALTATAILELFDLCALIFTDAAINWKRCSLFAEALLPPLWLLCSVTYARWEGLNKIGRLLKGMITLSFLLIVIPAMFPDEAFFYAPDFPNERLLFLGTTGFYYYLCIMTCLVCALINFESTLTNASPEALRKIKFDIIGLGSILAVLIFYYSQALLYRTINMSYTPLRAFLFVVASILMAFSRLKLNGNVRIYVSPHIAFKSFVLIAVGIYLIMLSLLGEGMKHLGTFFPRTVVITVAFLAGIGLLLVLLSEKFRREVKVVLHKSFYQNKHDYRTQWLRFTEQLSTSRSGEELQQRILSAYCEIFGIRGAVLFLYEEGRGGYCMTALYEMEPINEVISPENSLIKFMKERSWVINIRDENTEIMEENGYFFGEHSIFFVIPLFSSERLEGFIALGRAIKKDEVYIYEDYDLMKTIARQASLAIMHQRLSEQIIQSRAMEAIGNVATFVVHDLKNLVATLSLIVENGARHIQHPDFQKDMLTSLGNTVDKMQALIGRLKNLGDKNLLRLQPVNLLDLAQKTAGMVAGNRVTVEGEPVTALADGEELQKVILNLLINGIEASVGDSPVHIKVGIADSPFFRVTDQGCGMSDHFVRTDLFTPFKTTKKKGFGVGLYQSRQIIEAHNGRIEISSEEGHGSVFTVWLPKAVTREQ